MSRDVVRVRLQAFVDSRPDEVVTVEHERDDPRGGRLVTSLYLGPELARKTAEAILKALRADAAPVYLEVRE